jgi:hypothetical protein
MMIESAKKKKRCTVQGELKRMPKMGKTKKRCTVHGSWCTGKRFKKSSDRVYRKRECLKCLKCANVPKVKPKQVS